MYIEKHKLSVSVPAKLYQRLEMDFQNYGVAKSYVVAAALTAYYSALDTPPAARIPGVCQGARPDARTVETP